MKAAIIYHFFPHYRAGVLRELLKSREHEYLLVADDKPSEPSIRKWEIIDRARFSLAPCRKVFASFHVQKGLLKLALRRDLEAMIYLGNPYFISTWISAIAARLTGKRVLFWTHGWTRAERGMKGWLRSCFYRLADGLLLYGHFAKMSGLAKGFNADKLHVIYNSLDLEQQITHCERLKDLDPVKIKSEFFTQPELPMLICSARLTYLCRFDVLLEAQAQLRNAGHPSNVLLVGDGDEKAALKAQAQRLGLPVHFFGPCYDETKLASMIMAAHATVSPGKVGLTAMHSLAYGTPVITHNNGDNQMPEWEAIIPGRSGDFFCHNNASDLMRVLKPWISRKLPDPATRTECQRILKRFYNPSFQRRAIDRAVRGEPADDLFWMREAL